MEFASEYPITRGRQIAQYAHRCMQIAALVQFARNCLCNLRATAKLRISRYIVFATTITTIYISTYSYLYNQIELSLAALPRPTPDSFKPRNGIVERAFYPVVNATYKNPRKVCKYCHKEMDSNTTRLQEHLDKCRPYRAGKPPNEPVGGTQQFLPNMVAAMPETKVDHWKRAGMAKVGGQFDPVCHQT